MRLSKKRFRIKASSSSKLGFTIIVMYAAQSASASAFVGDVPHNWKVSTPLGDIGIVEWYDGHSTVFCGPVSFGVPLGAYATSAIALLIALLILCAAVWLGKKHTPTTE